MRSRSADGALIIHAPAGCIEYTQTRAPANVHNGRRLFSLGCLSIGTIGIPNESRHCLLSCGRYSVLLRAWRPVHAGGTPYPWTHPIDAIEIAPVDAVTDSGEELLALLEERGIDDVVVPAFTPTDACSDVHVAGDAIPAAHASRTADVPT
jgi:hypothetical protein